MKLKCFLPLVAAIGFLTSGENVSAIAQELNVQAVNVCLPAPFNWISVPLDWKLSTTHGDIHNVCGFSFENVDNEDVDFDMYIGLPQKEEASIGTLETQIKKYVKKKKRNKNIPILEQSYGMHDFKWISKLELKGHIKFGELQWLVFTSKGKIKMQLGDQFFSKWLQFTLENEDEQPSTDEREEFLQYASEEEIEKIITEEPEEGLFFSSKGKIERSVADQFAKWLQVAAEDMLEELYAEQFAKWLKYASDEDIEKLFDDQYKKWEKHFADKEWLQLAEDEFEAYYDDLFKNTVTIKTSSLIYATFVDDRLVLIGFSSPSSVFNDYLPLFEKTMNLISQP